MEHSDGPFVLLAMTPAGESALVEDRDHISLLKFSAQGYHREDANREDVQTAVGRYGWVLVYRAFATWADLEHFRVQTAKEAMRSFPDPKIHDYDRHDVEVVLKKIARAGSGHWVVAVKLLTDLLVHCPTVRRESDLFAKVSEELDRLGNAPDIVCITGTSTESTGDA